MDSRMSKYNVDENDNLSRVKKNDDLYKNLNKNDLDNYNVYNNTAIIGENKKNQIDIENLKKILDTRYKEVPKRKSIRLEDPEETYEKDLEITKEYDINSILNKAKSEKVTTYEEERVKKIRDTQYDILQKLDVEKEDPKEEKNENLLNLINTISINETKQNTDELDLLSSLKGDDKTEVLKPMEKETSNEVISKSLDEVKNEQNEITKLIKSTEEKTAALKSNDIEENFYTASTKFAKKDFEKLDIEDGKRSIVTEIIVVIILLAFIVGLFIFFKSILNF